MSGTDAVLISYNRVVIAGPDPLDQYQINQYHQATPRLGRIDWGGSLELGSWELELKIGRELGVGGAGVGSWELGVGVVVTVLWKKR